VNNDPRISASTRRKVLASIDQLGYKVNAIARSLKARRTLTVGFISPEIANDFFMTVAQGVENTLRSNGYNLIVCNSKESVEEERDRLELMVEQCVDGLIVAPASNRGEHFRVARDFHLPIVFVDRYVEGFEADAVLVDNVGGVYRAVQHLLDQGYERFGFIGGAPGLSTAQERYAGFLQALTDRGLPLEENWVRYGDFHTESGYRLMSELAALPHPPSCVFVSNYFMNLGATRYLIEHRGEPGTDIYLASFDDMDLSSVTGLRHLTIAQPMTRIGQRAAELLLRRISQGENGNDPIVERLPTELVIHE
jgi:LacI family transcriptional regulator